MYLLHESASKPGHIASTDYITVNNKIEKRLKEAVVAYITIHVHP
jgi:hypothetical protein